MSAATLKAALPGLSSKLLACILLRQPCQALQKETNTSKMCDARHQMGKLGQMTYRH